MSYTREETQRHRIFFERSAQREAELIQRAEELIAQRAKVTGVSPQKLINQIFDDEPDPPKSKQQVADTAIAAELVRRLGRRDVTGGGSGDDVG